MDQKSQEHPEERTGELYKVIEKLEIHQRTITTNKEQVEKHK